MITRRDFVRFTSTLALAAGPAAIALPAVAGAAPSVPPGDYRIFGIADDAGVPSGRSLGLRIRLQVFAAGDSNGATLKGLKISGAVGGNYCKPGCGQGRSTLMRASGVRPSRASSSRLPAGLRRAVVTGRLRSAHCRRNGGWCRDRRRARRRDTAPRRPR